jgi:hypothetical protein
VCCSSLMYAHPRCGVRVGRANVLVVLARSHQTPRLARGQGADRRRATAPLRGPEAQLAMPEVVSRVGTRESPQIPAHTTQGRRSRHPAGPPRPPLSRSLRRPLNRPIVLDRQRYATAVRPHDLPSAVDRPGGAGWRSIAADYAPPSHTWVRHERHLQPARLVGISLSPCRNRSEPGNATAGRMAVSGCLRT